MSDSPCRKASVSRTTGETSIEMSIRLDGTGAGRIETGVGFLDHMLTLFSRHSLIDLDIEARGDLHVDAHHTVEDVGICLGSCLLEAVGDKRGIHRYGSCSLPMDETLLTSSLDLSGRAFLVFNVEFPTPRVGEFDTELVREFWQAMASNARMNLHLNLQYGFNSHHIAEASFKATARALREAITDDPRREGIPSSKGSL